MKHSQPEFLRAQSWAAAVLVCSLAALLWVHAALGAEGPRLKPPLLQPDHSAQLELTNAAATNYVIQASPNLLSWFTVGRGWGSNGVLVVDHSAASNYPSS
jgi:hypothetical protein